MLNSPLPRSLPAVLKAPLNHGLPQVLIREKLRDPVGHIFL